jgi:predicted ATPase/class 3 adenylate cyclase
MRCSKCGVENRQAARFCDSCGSTLQLQCSSCGALNRPSAKFCDGCGACLTASASAEAINTTGVQFSNEIGARDKIDGERKTVTALFADIKGSMELMEDLDPEEARAIVDPALRLMIDAVRRYDGYIVQSTGDGIFALFGAPTAHEDHPQRTLYAALRVQEEMHRYSAGLRAAGNLPIEARIGVNTGEVVVRSISTAEGRTEYTPIGHSTSLAARMQALAPTGSIAATDATRKLCEGYFTFKSLGPTVVKGVSGPVNVNEVTGLGPLRTRFQRAAGRGLTKFVGREREMEALKHAAEQAKGGHGQIVAAMAEPGVGKSRLLFEYKAIEGGAKTVGPAFQPVNDSLERLSHRLAGRDACPTDWMVLEALSVSYGKASAYLPVIDLLGNYFDITTTDDERKRREKVAGKTTMLDRSLEDTLPYLFSLLGIVEGVDPLAQMDGQIKKRRTLEAIKRILLRESFNQPLMVIFEDLHWIDEQTQELLNLLAESIGTAKILLLVNYRPEYSHQWSSKTYYTQLRLDPLGRESAAEMLSMLLGDGVELDPLKRLITERTEGNPFFIEEMVQALFEDGVLVGNGVVKLAKSMNVVKVPATVQGVLAARIDRLSAQEKELLQTLAVLGREFPLGLVKHVIFTPDDALERGLSRLQAGEFIYEQPAAGEVEYVFKHALTQEVAYNALLIERRKLLHERAGEALESMYAERLDDHLGDLARHYSRSDNFSKAVEYLGRAGQQAFQRAAYADAISSLSAATALLQKLPESPERIQREVLLLLAIGAALISVRGNAPTPEAEAAYSRARELCERVGDPPELFPALWGLWLMHLLRGELRRAYELADQLLPRAQSARDPALLMYAHLALGNTLLFMGHLLSAREHLELAISLYDPERHRPLAFRYGGNDPRVVGLSRASWTLWLLGYPDQALERGNGALALAQGLSQPQSLAFAKISVGRLHQFRGDVRAVQENMESLITLCAEYGLTNWLVYATIVRGWAMAEQGRTQEGIAQIQEALANTHAPGWSEIYRPYYLSLLAEACGEAGRLDEGLSALTEALATADEHENRHYEAEMHRLKGELLLKQDDTNATAAQSCFEHAVEIARRQSAKALELRATMSLARLLRETNRRDEARTMLAEIYNWFTEGFDTADLKDAKALLDELGN